MIATIHKESTSIETENDSIKTILWSNNLPTSNLPMARHRQSDQPLRVYGGPWPLPNSPLEQTRPCQDVGSMLGTSVTIDFDYTIDASCLQAYHSSTNGPEISINTPTMFNFPANAFADGCGIASHTPDLLKPVPSCPDQSRVPLDLKTAEIAINFILAYVSIWFLMPLANSSIRLEHPCRMQFRPIPTDFSPKGSPTGHELMASTSLYAYAPPYVFANPSEVAWDIPSSPVTELQKLREMNESLPKRDSDITPVQAWFLLAEKYDMGVLLGNEEADRRDKAQREGGFLGQLKRELSTLVECFGFGAVMDTLTFWEVAERVDLTRNCKM